MFIPITFEFVYESNSAELKEITEALMGFELPPDWDTLFN